ncbi:hypothetical protein MNBD_NITROSPIRAE03-1638 [hydrothermal vent metagenome]|uniref:PEP-CTERM protein-sorting domain-containing protein n=1 Tax=hydrothermal vent metagenome TaxID=652676 RepID=A0A3B1CVN6_9ZZZZ
MKSVILILSLALLIFGGVSVADATTVDFQIGADNSIDYDSALNIDFRSSIVSPYPEFTLGVGDSFTFDYGTIERIEVITSQDTYSITAYLSFVLPEEIVVGSDGTVETVKVHGMGRMESDKFSISFNPETVQFDTDGEFTVQMRSIDAYPVTGGDTCGFNRVCYSPNEDEGTITAKVTLNSSPTAVPEPSTFILFGTILIGALGVKRIKR